MASMKRKLKGAVKSKVILGNAAVIAAGAVDVLANSGMVLAALGPWGPLGLALVNMALRNFTTQSLEAKAD